MCLNLVFDRLLDDFWNLDRENVWHVYTYYIHVYMYTCNCDTYIVQDSFYNLFFLLGGGGGGSEQLNIPFQSISLMMYFCQ